MVNTLDKPETAAPGDDYPDDVELPTNRLNSSNLQSTHSIPEEVGNDTYEIDWVQALTSLNPVTQQFNDEDEEPSPQTAPSGMGQHITGPARMVPAKKSLLPGGVKRGLVTLLIVLGIAGGAGAGIYALVDSGWLATLFTPQAAPTTPPISSQPQIQPTQQPQPPSVQEPTAIPQATVAGVAAQLRDRGVEQYKQGHYDEAIKLLEGVVSAGTDDARTYYHLGLAYMAVTGREHSLDDAELAFRTAVSLEPTWAAANSMLAESLIRRAYYTEAIPPALEATRLDPNSGDAWLTLSRAYKGAGQEAEATRALAEASRRAPVPPMQP